MNPKRLLTSEQEQKIIQAIKKAESKSSGEIRVHITNQSGTGNLAHAQKIFHELSMHETKYRNGVLLHISPVEKTFSIVGDEGIHQYVKQEFWDMIRNEVINEFKQGNYFEGILRAVYQTGEKLKLYFPIDKDDKNELSDEISYT
jgi:uncharacterized membrane protein